MNQSIKIIHFHKRKSTDWLFEFDKQTIYICLFMKTLLNPWANFKFTNLINAIMKPDNLKSILFYSSFILLIIISGCKKEEPTNTELLCKEWKIISVDGESATEYFELDEVLIKFSTDGGFKITWISDGDEDINYGIWIWQNSEEKLDVELDFNEVEWELEKLTEDDFWFYDIDDDSHFKCVIK